MTSGQRDQAIASLRQARDEIRPNAPLNAETLHIIIDAALLLIDNRLSTEPDPPLEPDPFDLEEAPSIYWWIRHPIV